MMSKGPHRVAVLALPAVIPLELGIAAEIFGRDPHYRLTVCAEGRSVAPWFWVDGQYPPKARGLKRADTLIIPGYEDADATVSTAVLDAIGAAHARAPDWYRSAPPLLRSPRLVSSTTVPPPPTGGGPLSSKTATPGSTCCPTASSSTTATSSRRLA